MEAILTFFAGFIIGWGASCLFGAKKLYDSESGESYWRELYHLEKEKKGVMK